MAVLNVRKQDYCTMEFSHSATKTIFTSRKKKKWYTRLCRSCHNNIMEQLSRVFSINHEKALIRSLMGFWPSPVLLSILLKIQCLCSDEIYSGNALSSPFHSIAMSNPARSTSYGPTGDIRVLKKSYRLRGTDYEIHVRVSRSFRTWS